MDSDWLSMIVSFISWEKIVLGVIPTISFLCAFIVIVVCIFLVIFIVIVLGVNSRLELYLTGQTKYADMRMCPFLNYDH